MRQVPCLGPYSKGLSDRNRLAGGSQLISKFLREIEPTVSQFLNVCTESSQREEPGVSIGLPLTCSITSGAIIIELSLRCLSARRSIDPRRGAGRYGLTVSGAISNLKLSV